jgi:hypothetical protein
VTLIPGLDDSVDEGVGDDDGVGDCDGVGLGLGDGELCVDGNVVVVVGDDDGCTYCTNASAASSMAFARSGET